MNSQITNASFNDVIFEKRNKSYGAYALRTQHDKRIVKSFFITISSIVLILGVPTIIRHMNFDPIKTNIPIISSGGDTVIYIIPPPIDPVIDPPTPPAKPASSVASTAPIEVTNDSLRPDENEPPKPTDDGLLSQSPTNPSSGNDSGLNPEPNPEPGSTGGNGTEPKPDITDFPQTNPSFPNGEKGIKDFIYDHLKVPEDLIVFGKGGKVYVSFVVEKDGGISNIEILKGLGYGTEQEIERVIKLMPKWTPGMNGDKPVRVRLRLPLVIHVN